MGNQPTPGSTGDAGDAGQLNDTGAIRTRTDSLGRTSFLYDGRWRPVFSGGDGTEGGGGEGGGEGGGNDDPGAGGPGEKDTFTKDEIERIVQQRVAAEKKKFSDYDDLKRQAAEYQKLEDAKKTEIEKANERATAAEREKAERENELKTERTRNAVFAVASELSFVNPSVAHRLVDPSDLEYDDAGRPQKESVKKALEALAQSDPYLVGKLRPRGDGGGGPRGGAPDGEPTMSERIRALAGSKRVTG